MRCDGCSREDAYFVKTVYTKEGRYEYCNFCSTAKPSGIPDVSFSRPYFDEHLANAQFPNGQWVNSKLHKAQIMKDLGVREAGSDVNKRLGRPMPFIKDTAKRVKFMKDNFGG